MDDSLSKLCTLPIAEGPAFIGVAGVGLVGEYALSSVLTGLLPYSESEIKLNISQEVFEKSLKNFSYLLVQVLVLL